MCGAGRLRQTVQALHQNRFMPYRACLWHCLSPKTNRRQKLGAIWNDWLKSRWYRATTCSIWATRHIPLPDTNVYPG